MKSGLKIVILCLILFIFSCAHYRSFCHSDKIKNAIDSLVIIETRGWIKEEVESKKIRAIGIPIRDNLLLSLTHATSIDPYIEVRVPYGMVFIPREVFSEQYFVNGKPLKILGMTNKIKLFQFQSNSIFPFKFGKFSQVKIGNQVLVIGYSAGRQINIKDGIVSNLKGIDDEDEFMVSAPINFGDSGGPVLAYGDGNYEVIGLASAKLVGYEGMGYVLNIDYIKKCIVKILTYEFDEF